ncbi:DUF2341 domain-containing protein [Patescibacteria group bacterium]|nr:DUF2341 domain-containing protein [Patescibacteria group bacterium]
MKKVLFVFVIMMLGGLFFVDPDPSYAAGWLDSSWGYRMPITIHYQSVAADLADFPVLINLTDLSHINDNGADIRFTQSDGTTQVPREIESFADGTLWAWVKTDLSHSEDTVLYMYYGNSAATEPDASSDYGSQNVWTNGYAGVWHLNEAGTNPAASDSSSNGNSSTTQTWTPDTGLIAGGGTFNGSSNSINIPSKDSLNPASITVSAWVKADVNNKWQYAVLKNNQWDFGRDNSGKYYLAAWNSDGNNVADEHSVSSADTGSWELINFTYDGSEAKYYVNTGIVIDKAVTKSLMTTENPVNIGSQGGSSNYWDGMIDEVRIADVARSADWIDTEYTNQADPTKFLTTGEEETAPISTPTPTPASHNLSPAENHASSPVCSAVKPIGNPDLFQIDTNSSSAKLYFTTSKSDVSGYLISYGLTADAQDYATKIYYSGSKWIVDSTINGLSSNTAYYFKIKPLNGCNSGEWSNAMLVKTSSQPATYYQNLLSQVQNIAANVLGAATIVNPNQAVPSINSCSYIVVAGDTLWDIAQRKYGNGTKYQQIIGLNPGISSILHPRQTLTLCH